MIPSVVCVLRRGGDYTPEHVRALYAGVRKHWPASLPLRFVALTDETIGTPGIEERRLHHDWPGWWSKMEVTLGAQNDLGDVLYFDLDTMIVGGLLSIASVGRFTLLRDFYRDDRLQSGMMYLPAATRTMICAAWLDTPADNMEQYRGDGEFIYAVAGSAAAVWQDVLPLQVVSYKVDVRQRKGQTIPPRTRVVCFHGKPRPWHTALWTRGL